MTAPGAKYPTVAAGVCAGLGLILLAVVAVTQGTASAFAVSLLSLIAGILCLFGAFLTATERPDDEPRPMAVRTGEGER